MRRNRNADSQVIFGSFSPQFGNGKRENGFATFSSRFAHPGRGINILYLLYATTCLSDGRMCQFDMSISQIDGVEKYADEFLGTTQSPPYLFYTATFCRVDRVFGHKILGLSKRENIPHKSQTHKPYPHTWKTCVSSQQASYNTCRELFGVLFVSIC